MVLKPLKLGVLLFVIGILVIYADLAALEGPWQNDRSGAGLAKDRIPTLVALGKPRDGGRIGAVTGAFFVDDEGAIETLALEPFEANSTAPNGEPWIHRDYDFTYSIRYGFGGLWHRTSRERTHEIGIRQHLARTSPSTGLADSLRSALGSRFGDRGVPDSLTNAGYGHVVLEPEVFAFVNGGRVEFAEAVPFGGLRNLVPASGLLLIAGGIAVMGCSLFSARASQSSTRSPARPSRGSR